MISCCLSLQGMSRWVGGWEELLYLAAVIEVGVVPDLAAARGHEKALGGVVGVVGWDGEVEFEAAAVVRGAGGGDDQDLVEEGVGEWVGELRRYGLGWVGGWVGGEEEGRNEVLYSRGGWVGRDGRTFQRRVADS